MRSQLEGVGGGRNHEDVGMNTKGGTYIHCRFAMLNDGFSDSLLVLLPVSQLFVPAINMLYIQM